MYAGQPRGFRFILLIPSRLQSGWPLTAIHDDEQCWPQASNDAISAAFPLREPARGRSPSQPLPGKHRRWARRNTQPRSTPSFRGARIRAGRRRGETSAGNLEVIVNGLHLPIGTQQISRPKSVLRSIVAPTTEELGANVPFDPVTITHEPMIGAVINRNRSS